MYGHIVMLIAPIVEPPLTRFQRYSTDRPGDVLQEGSRVGLHCFEQVIAEAFDNGSLLGREVQVLAVRAEHIGDRVRRDIAGVVGGQHP
jgi:hypothetical protein